MTNRRNVLRSVLLLLAFVGLPLMAATDANASVSGTNPCPSQPSYPWMGDSLATPVSIPSQAQPSGISAYDASILRPSNLAEYPGKRPVVALAHGSGGNKCSIFWAAQDLAGHGYIAIVSTAPGIGQAQRFAADQDAQVSAIAFARSDSNPYVSVTDGQNVAAVGWSLGSSVSSYNQSLPSAGVRAVVAFDTLHRYIANDPGTPDGCTDTPSGEITPAVPALGFASDLPCPTDPPNYSKDLKFPGFYRWRDAGLPVSELVMRGFVHTDFGTNGTETQHHDLAYFTEAWLAKYLLGDARADSAFFKDTVDGRPTGDVLSSSFDSGLYLPDLGVDLTDLGQYLDQNAGAPTTEKLSRPSGHFRLRPKQKRHFKFRFTSDEPYVTFQCRLDHHGYHSCHSPFVVKRRLGRGVHTVAVLSTDPGGLVSSKPAKWKFRIIRSRHT